MQAAIPLPWYPPVWGLSCRLRHRKFRNKICIYYFRSHSQSYNLLSYSFELPTKTLLPFYSSFLLENKLQILQYHPGGLRFVGSGAKDIFRLRKTRIPFVVLYKQTHIFSLDAVCVYYLPHFCPFFPTPFRKKGGKTLFCWYFRQEISLFLHFLL